MRHRYGAERADLLVTETLSISDIPVFRTTAGPRDTTWADFDLNTYLKINIQISKNEKYGLLHLRIHIDLNSFSPKMQSS
jgi:hypothetical protein